MSPWRWQGDTVPDQPPPWWVRTGVTLLWRIERARWSPLIADIRRQGHCQRWGGHYWHTAFNPDADSPAAPVCYLCAVAMR